MKYTYSFNGKSIFFFCSDTMKDTAEFFSSVLQHEDLMCDVIRSNRAIQIGWGFYKVLQAGSEYQIVARDLLGDPFQAMTADLSLSLEIFAQQRNVLRVTKATPKETSFQDSSYTWTPSNLLPPVIVFWLFIWYNESSTA